MYAIVFGSTIAMTTLTSNGFFAIAIIVHGSNSGIVIEIFGMRKRNTYVVLFHEQESYRKIESRLGLINNIILRINRIHIL